MKISVLLALALPLTISCGLHQSTVDARQSAAFVYDSGAAETGGLFEYSVQGDAYVRRACEPGATPQLLGECGGAERRLPRVEFWRLAAAANPAMIGPEAQAKAVEDLKAQIARLEKEREENINATAPLNRAKAQLPDAEKRLTEFRGFEKALASKVRYDARRNGSEFLDPAMQSLAPYLTLLANVFGDELASQQDVSCSGTCQVVMSQTWTDNSFPPYTSPYPTYEHTSTTSHGDRGKGAREAIATFCAQFSRVERKQEYDEVNTWVSKVYSIRCTP